MERCNIIGVNINVTDMAQTVKIIEENLSKIRGNYICISNVHTTVMAHDNEFYRMIQNQSYMSLPDGKPLSIVSRIRGYKSANRVTGPDLMNELFKLSERKGYTHYFYGSTEDTLKKLDIKLMEMYPKLQVTGMFSPPFRELEQEEDNEIIKAINRLEPDFLWVGLGAPKQEIWMYNHKNKVNSIMIGVGAGFDYYAGNIKRAPLWMQRISLEWLYRLLQDPKRLWRRYLETNVKFIFYEMRGGNKQWER